MQERQAGNDNAQRQTPRAACRRQRRRRASSRSICRRRTLSAAMQAYFAKCEEKLGFVPNVLEAYAFDMRQARGVRRHVQRPDAGASGPVQARARDDRGRGVVAQPLLLLPGRAWRRGARAVRRSGARRADGDELSRRAARRSASAPCSISPSSSPPSRGRSRRRTAKRLRRAGFTERDIWDIAAVAGFFNMSNRVASRDRHAAERGVSRAGALTLPIGACTDARGTDHLRASAWRRSGLERRLLARLRTTAQRSSKSTQGGDLEIPTHCGRPACRHAGDLRRRADPARSAKRSW